jgi:hypothetical protein
VGVRIPIRRFRGPAAVFAVRAKVFVIPRDERRVTNQENGYRAQEHKDQRERAKRAKYRDHCGNSRNDPDDFQKNPHDQTRGGRGARRQDLIR